MIKVWFIIDKKFIRLKILYPEGREPCPGQSTRVTRTSSRGQNEENPKSRVIPRSLLCGFLSNELVDPIWERHFERVVFPLSTWPNIPQFIFLIFLKFKSISLVHDKEGYVIQMVGSIPRKTHPTLEKELFARKKSKFRKQNIYYKNTKTEIYLKKRARTKQKIIF